MGNKGTGTPGIEMPGVEDLIDRGVVHRGEGCCCDHHGALRDALLGGVCSYLFLDGNFCYHLFFVLVTWFFSICCYKGLLTLCF